MNDQIWLIIIPALAEVIGFVLGMLIFIPFWEKRRHSDSLGTRNR